MRDRVAVTLANFCLRFASRRYRVVLDESAQDLPGERWPHCPAVANANDNFGRCLLPVGHSGSHLSEFGDAFTERQASTPASTPEETS